LAGKFSAEQHVGQLGDTPIPVLAPVTSATRPLFNWEEEVMKATLKTDEATDNKKRQAA
jgi:hypothetical protein